MRVADLIRMSIANLWSRRWRTILNLIGVVIGCMLMILMFAGTRGVSSSLFALLDSNHAARIIYIQPNIRNDAIEAPKEVVRVEGELDALQRKLIGKRLEQDWKSKNTVDRELTLEMAESLRSMEHVTDVIPVYFQRLEVVYEGKQFTTACSGVSSTDPQLKLKLIAGRLPESGEDSVLINRFVAYQLGCTNDSDLSGLIGKKLSLRYKAKSAAPPNTNETSELPANWLVKSMGHSRVIEALASLKSQLHKIDLPRDQKLVLTQALADWLDNYQPAESVEREFEICGVVKLMESEGFPENIMWFGAQADDIALHGTVVRSILNEHEQNVLTRGAKLRVDSLSNLVQVDKQLTAQGFYTASLSHFLEHLENEMNNVRWVLSAIGLAIFCITALFISNSMVMSVLERTTEFGIMKALGASGRQIMGMMLWEGAMIGLAGSVIAAFASVVFAGGIEQLVRQYVSTRLGTSFAGNVFQFSWMEILAAVGVAIIFCMIASFFPAFRASRLDPINAMRNT